MNRKSLSHCFSHCELLEQALTHRSFHNESPGQSSGHNERFEFLGDAVVDLAITDTLMREFPEMSEGDLSKIRASLVNEVTLASLASELGLGERLRLGRGEMKSGGRVKPRLLASAFEAYVGAVYLDAGFEKTNLWLKGVFADLISGLDLSVHFSSDYKSRLQELLQDTKRQAPVYETLESTGPDHAREFLVEVRLGSEVLAKGIGRSKKQAEQAAAKAAFYLQKQGEKNK